ncbi:hypothetical protein ACH5RR_028242 [Cinchona calisaya]|uniref:Transmembrane protein n=1 Tax=Cinchona calisaya TaxID=153742 RepID=A0ABD2YQE7_9GENT
MKPNGVKQQQRPTKSSSSSKVVFSLLNLAEEPTIPSRIQPTITLALLLPAVSYIIIVNISEPKLWGVKLRMVVEERRRRLTGMDGKEKNYVIVK